MIVRLHHAQITIPNGAEEQCRRFYCGVLGMNEIVKPAELRERGGFWLELGDIQIHVGTEQNIERAASKAHLAYEVNDLPAWRAKLKETGTTVKDAIRIPGYERFEFRDPFGNRVEFLQKVNEE